MAESLCSRKWTDNITYLQRLGLLDPNGCVTCVTIQCSTSAVLLSYLCIWSSTVCVEAHRSLNNSSKFTFVEKASRQGENTNLIDKYKNKASDEALSKTHDTLRGDKPVIFPSRKLYTETNQIWFENINSIYLREEMRCWVEEQLALSTTETKHLLVIGPSNHFAHTKSAFLTPLHVCFACSLVFCVLLRIRCGRTWASDRRMRRWQRKEEVLGIITELDLCELLLPKIRNHWRILILNIFLIIHKSIIFPINLVIR